MSRSLSVFLDLLRFVAALVVVVGHLTQGSFSTGWPDLTLAGVAAVSIFFVLSGFVISYVASTREHSPREYSVARISRLYSVLVPCVIFSGLVLWLGMRVDPGYMAEWTSGATSLGFLAAHPVLRFFSQSLLTLTFLNSIHNHEAYPAMNSPVWSIGFEAFYYAFFGILLFARGKWRVVLLALTALVAGGGIVRLLPVWWAGVVLHRLTEKRKGKQSWVVGFVLVLLIAVACMGWPAFSAWSKVPHAYLMELFLHGKDRASTAYLFYYWGVVSFALIFAASELEGFLGQVLLPLEKPIRWCAGHTFSIYLFHFPLLVCIYLLTHYDRSSAAKKLMVFVVVLAGCAVLSLISEEKKLAWRRIVKRGLDAVLPRRRAANAQADAR